MSDDNNDQARVDGLARMAEFVFELGQLRLEDRRGWNRLRIKPESVADHSLRAAQLAFLIACGESHPNPESVAVMLLFHDMTEIRSSDPDRISRLYVTIDEEKILSDQVQSLGAAGERIASQWHEFHDRKTAAALIARDADSLEMAFTAKELIESGHAEAQTWFDSAGRALTTQTARELYRVLSGVNPDDWWKRVISS